MINVPIYQRFFVGCKFRDSPRSISRVRRIAEESERMELDAHQLRRRFLVVVLIAVFVVVGVTRACKRADADAWRRFSP